MLGGITETGSQLLSIGLFKYMRPLVTTRYETIEGIFLWQFFIKKV